MPEFKFRLTAEAQKHQQCGEKQCSICKEIKPVDQFYKLNNYQHEYSRFFSDCIQCHNERYNRKRYYQGKADNNQNILSTTECDVCGEGGTLYFWRCLDGRTFDNWTVIHKRCKKEAVEMGLIPSINKKLRSLKDLEIKPATPADLDRKHPNKDWTEPARKVLEGSRVKTCTKCGETKPVEEFPVFFQRSKKRIGGQCRVCRCAKEREYQAKSRALKKKMEGKS